MAEPDDKTRQILLVEYQAAQDSAQFHDGLIWTVSSIMWGGSLVLLGFMVAAEHGPGNANLAVVIALLGLLLNVSVWVISWQLRKIKNHKYKRCKAIEKELPPLEQHKSLDHFRGMQTAIHSIINVLFCICWLYVLLIVSGAV